MMRPRATEMGMKGTYVAENRDTEFDTSDGAM